MFNAMFLGVYLPSRQLRVQSFKVNNRNTRARCEVCSKLTTKTPERLHWRRSSVFIVSLEYIYHVFQFLSLNREMPAGYYCLE